MMIETIKGASSLITIIAILILSNKKVININNENQILLPVYIIIWNLDEKT